MRSTRIKYHTSWLKPVNTLETFKRKIVRPGSTQDGPASVSKCCSKLIPRVRPEQRLDTGLWLIGCLLTYLLAWLSACLLTYLPTYLLIYLILLNTSCPVAHKANTRDRQPPLFPSQSILLHFSFKWPPCVSPLVFLIYVYLHWVSNLIQSSECYIGRHSDNVSNTGPFSPLNFCRNGFVPRFPMQFDIRNGVGPKYIQNSPKTSILKHLQHVTDGRGYFPWFTQKKENTEDIWFKGTDLSLVLGLSFFDFHTFFSNEKA